MRPCHDRTRGRLALDQRGDDQQLIRGTGARRLGRAEVQLPEAVLEVRQLVGDEHLQLDGLAEPERVGEQEALEVRRALRRAVMRGVQQLRASCQRDVIALDPLLPEQGRDLRSAVPSSIVSFVVGTGGGTVVSLLRTEL